MIFVVASVALTVLLMLASASDIRARRVPNLLNAVVLSGGLLFQVLSPRAGDGWSSALAGLAVGFGIWFPMYLFRLVGAGETTTGAACFTAPALHDIASADGRKLCGGAQRRTRRGFLHQGSLLGSVPPSGHLAAVFAERVENRPESARLEARTQELCAEKYANPAWQARIP